MKRSPETLRTDALAIWRAGVDGVDSQRLIEQTIRRSGDLLLIEDYQVSLDAIRRIVVVGAGKAGAGMALGVERALGPDLIQDKKLTGWVNVPQDCVKTTHRIVLHPARPAGHNEPTEAGVAGSEQILKIVGALTPNDLCLCLLSGGGSALLPAPLPTITLSDKQAVTRALSAAGANIEELNTVRKQLSRIKGGRLAQACRGALFTLVISDVIGDPLDIIASGPTVPNSTTAADALAIVRRFAQQGAEIPPRIDSALRQAVAEQSSGVENRPPTPTAMAHNIVVGNNALAVDAAGIEAERRGYSHAMHAAIRLEGEADEVGVHLARMAHRMRTESGPDCLITGGEPVVQLIDSARRGRGGRNQQLVLAALIELLRLAPPTANPLAQIALLAGGTDGEDGPTDAAGAIIDPSSWPCLQQHGLAPQDFLARNDAYHFFEKMRGLIRTGPTHTNVCDIRVVTVSQEY